MSDEVTISELAEQVGMTVRNVRAHQARGLIPPPRRVGRVGYYGAEHRARLEQIREMQAEGLNLAAIARVLHADGLTQVGTSVFERRRPRTLSAQEVDRRLGGALDDDLTTLAVELGFVDVEGDQYRLKGPGLLAVAEELLALGIPLDAQFESFAGSAEKIAAVAVAYRELVEEHLLPALAESYGDDPERAQQILARTRDLALHTVSAAFDQALREQMAAFFEGTDEPAGTTRSEPTGDDERGVTITG